MDKEDRPDKGNPKVDMHGVRVKTDRKVPERLPRSKPLRMMRSPQQLSGIEDLHDDDDRTREQSGTRRMKRDQ